METVNNLRSCLAPGYRRRLTASVRYRSRRVGASFRQTLDLFKPFPLVMLRKGQGQVGRF